MRLCSDVYFVYLFSVCLLKYTSGFQKVDFLSVLHNELYTTLPYKLHENVSASKFPRAPFLWNDRYIPDNWFHFTHSSLAYVFPVTVAF